VRCNPGKANERPHMPIPHLDRARLDRGAEHLSRLGSRALAEFLAELASTIGGMPATLWLLADYEHRLDPKRLRATGGHRMLPSPIRPVPADLARAPE